MTSIDQLRKLYMLRKLAEGKLDDNISQLEEEFLRFSQNTPKHSLVVQVPKMYALDVKGDEPAHAAAALATLGVQATPTHIDISGAFDRSVPNDLVMFLSNQQMNADHSSSLRSYLTPLIEQVYQQSKLIRDFALHEALIGKVVARRDGLTLAEAPLFPERFSPGEYNIVVDLDTPLNTVKKFLGLHQKLNDVQANPKRLLDTAFTNQVTKEALELRSILGSLSRYDCPPGTTVEAKTSSVVLRKGESTLYYFFANNQNIMVHFGPSPYHLGKVPKALRIVDGNEYQHALVALVEAGVYDPAPGVLDQRIKDFTRLYDESARMSGAPVNYSGLDELLTELKRMQRSFASMVNADMQRKALKHVRPEAIEFMVSPNKDLVAHELLPRLSWNKALREYHDAEGFIKTFTASGDEERSQMLSTIASSAVFSYQQNNDVNLWLYQNHHDFVIENGVEFKVEK